jgi:hypothetical protein
MMGLFRDIQDGVAALPLTFHEAVYLARPTVTSRLTDFTGMQDGDKSDTWLAKLGVMCSEFQEVKGVSI